MTMTTTLAELITTHHIDVDPHLDRDLSIPILTGAQRQGDVMILPRPDRRGRDLGLFNLANTVPSLVMPWLAMALVPMFGFPALFLLLAAANAANLTLAKALGRRREVAVQTALGASRGQLLREYHPYLDTPATVSLNPALGRIVEYTDKRTLFSRPQHPYTESLLLAETGRRDDAKRAWERGLEAARKRYGTQLRVAAA